MQFKERIGESGSLGRRIAEEMDVLTLEKVTKVGFANAQANARVINEGKSILELRHSPLMVGENALVIAAGPSLHKGDTAAIIKASTFQGVIISTESSMAWCLRNDIIPDLVVTLDPHPHRIIRWFGDPDLTEQVLQKDDYYSRQDMDPKFRENEIRFNEELIRLVNANAPRIRIALSSSAPANVVRRVVQSGMDTYWWNPMYDDYELETSLTRQIHSLNRLPCLNTGGNVGSACWVFAHAVLEKKRVGLLGMDFGYYADTPYSRTQYYDAILDLVGPERLDEVFVRITNPFLNQEFYTDPAYLWYRDSFLEMAGEARCETYNCTGGGILFGPGIRSATLFEFLSTCIGERSSRAKGING
jgi:hypothetical protein